MTPQEVQARDNITITLSGSSKLLNELVVVAYGTQKKSSLTGAVSMIDSKAIEMRPVTSITSALEGITSGVQINNTYGQPGSSPAKTYKMLYILKHLLSLQHETENNDIRWLF